MRAFERAGVSRSVAMQLTGHKTESVYRRYALVSEGDLGAGIEKLGQLSSGTIGGTKKRKGRIKQFRHSSYRVRIERLPTDAGVAKLADAQDLKSWVPQGACGFDSRPRHSITPMNTASYCTL